MFEVYRIFAQDMLKQVKMENKERRSVGFTPKVQRSIP